MQSSSAPIVGAFGSCRIMGPLNRLQRTKKIVTRYKNIDWYTHSARDALQKMEIVTGRRTLADHEVPLVAHGADRWHPETHHAGIFNDVTCFVVEISSLKLTSYRGLEIQQWCLRDILLGQGIHVGQFNKVLGIPTGERNLDFLPNTTSDLVRDIAACAISIKQSATDLYEDLHRICVVAERPVIFVSHINVEGSSGTLLDERVLISEVVHDFCDSRGLAFVDPTVHVLAYGRDGALVDLSHYKSDFETIMGEKMGEAIERALVAQMSPIE